MQRIVLSVGLFLMVMAVPVAASQMLSAGPQLSGPPAATPGGSPLGVLLPDPFAATPMVFTPARTAADASTELPARSAQANMLLSAAY